MPKPVLRVVVEHYKWTPWFSHNLFGCGPAEPSEFFYFGCSPSGLRSTSTRSMAMAQVWTSSNSYSGSIPTKRCSLPAPCLPGVFMIYRRLEILSDKKVPAPPPIPRTPEARSEESQEAGVDLPF